MIKQLMWASGGTLTLMLVYQHLRVTWPESYFGPAESVAYVFSRTGPRFVLFRFLPPYLVFVTVGVYGPEDANGTVWFCALLYIIASTVLSLGASARGVPNSAPLKIQRLLVLAVTAAALVGCAWLATATVPVAAPHAPELGEVLANLIAAALTAVLVVSFLMATRSSSEPARRALSFDTLREIEATAVECCVDPDLATAIARVENEQRPPWFRRLERGMHRLRPGGSYGLFQVAGHGPVSDRESCRIALEHLTGSWPILNSEGYPVDWSVFRIVEMHNPDSRFAERVSELYFDRTATRVKWSDGQAADQRPVVDVWSVGRFREQLRARGTFWIDIGPVSVETRALGADDWKPSVVVLVNDGGPRIAWFADLPAESVEFRVVWKARRRDEHLVIDLRKYGVVQRETALRDVTRTPSAR